MARIIAAAQYAALAGDIEGNLHRHLQFATTAATLGVQLLVFPELSLTGYEVALADELPLSPHAAMLEPLRMAARASSMTIVAGVPVRFAGSDLHIGEFAFLPDGHVAVYTKRFLDGPEKRVFAPARVVRACIWGGLYWRWQSVRTFRSRAMRRMPLQTKRVSTPPVCW